MECHSVLNSRSQNTAISGEIWIASVIGDIYDGWQLVGCAEWSDHRLSINALHGGMGARFAVKDEKEEVVVVRPRRKKWVVGRDGRDL